MKIPDHLKGIYKEARRKGWEVSFTRNSHLKWKGPTGQIIFTAGTASCYRGRKNEVALFKKAGIEA